MKTKPKNVLLLYTDKYYLVKQVYPFGLDLLAQSLRNRGHRVVVDYPFLPRQDMEANLREILRKTSPDVIGLGIRNLDTCLSCEEYGDYRGEDFSTFYFLPSIREMVAILKKRAPGVPIVAGGGAFTISPEALMRDLGIDYGIVGEGEEPMDRFLKAFPDPEEISKIPGMVLVNEDRITVNHRLPYRFSPTGAVCRRDPGFRYAYESSGLPVQVKRGCNQRCSYCVEPLIEGRKILFRDEGDVIDELKNLSGVYPGVTIFFVDTEFNLPDTAYPASLLGKILDQGLNEYFRFSTQMLPRPFDYGFASLLARAGFSIIFTCDSFDDAVLSRNHSPYRQEDIIRAVEICDELGITCTLAMIFGLPGETLESIHLSLDLVKRYPPTPGRRYEYTVGGRIYKGTPLCRFIEKGGQDEHLYGKVSEGYLEPLYYCSPKSPLTLKKYLDASFPNVPAYKNGYDPLVFKSLALSYLIDRNRWGDALEIYLASDLDVQSMIYDYYVRRAADAGRTEDAGSLSLRLVQNIQASPDSWKFGDRLELARFYLSHLKPC